MRTALPLTLLVMAGCAATTPDAAPATAGPAKCELEPLKPMIGQITSDATAAEALKLSGARTIRWKPPGAMVTMDYRPDRLNISLDAQNRITAFDCG